MITPTNFDLSGFVFMDLQEMLWTLFFFQTIKKIKKVKNYVNLNFLNVLNGSNFLHKYQ